MKLTQFAFAAILVLLLVAGYLTMKSDFDSRQDAQNDFNKEMLARMEDLAKKQTAPAPIAPPPAAPVPEAPVAAAPVPPPAPLSPAAVEALAAAAAIPANAPLAPENDARMLEDERQVLNLGANDRVTEDSLTLPDGVNAQALTPLQRRIAAAPPIARIKHYAAKEGMLVLDRGTSVNLMPGQTFALRRNSAVIGRIRISDTIEANESVADVMPNSMPPGMLPQTGDEVIQFD